MCQMCKPGQYASSVEQVLCQGEACVENTYGPSGQTKAHACFACPGGQHTTQRGQEACAGAACSKGKYFDTASQKCTPCTPGTYQDWEGMNDCKGEPCASGKYGILGAVAANRTCFDCGAGQYTDAQGQAQCKGNPCVAGKYHAAGQAARHVCKSCLPGQYADQVGQGTCKGFACAAGTYGTAGMRSASMWTTGNTLANAVAASPNKAATATIELRTTVLLEESTRTIALQDAAPGVRSASVRRAFYGDPNALWDLKRGAYVTETVREYLDANKDVFAINSIFGDPLDGVSKVLAVEYMATSYGCTGCEAGRYSDSAGQTACEGDTCVPGKYSPNVRATAASACLDCDFGRFNGAAAQSFCHNCTTGQYSDLLGQTQCKMCAAGKFAGVTGGAEQCTKCIDGKFQDAQGEASCKDCPEGQFRDSAIPAVRCLPCAGGQHWSAAGPCKDCAAGKYRPARVEASGLSKDAFNARFVAGSGVLVRECSTCVDSHKFIVYVRRSTPSSETDWHTLFMENWSKKQGTTGNELGVDFALFSSMVDARANRNGWTFCNYDDPGIGFPRDCGPTASVASQWNSANRGGRSVRWYMPSTKLVCDECPAGRFSATHGRTICTACKPGTFQSFVGATNCRSCAVGRHQAGSAAHNCSACSPGKVTSNQGALLCTPCGKGRYIDAPGRGECKDCPADTFSAVQGTASCTACATGYSTNNRVGQQACRITSSGCKLGQFWSKEGNVCQDCASGLYADAIGFEACAECPDGKFNTATRQADCIEQTVRACPAGKFVVPAVAANDGSCQPCPDGTFQSAFSEATSCTAWRESCGIGHYMTEGTSERDRGCKECPLGTYNDVVSEAAICNACARGLFQDQKGQASCKACEPGTFFVRADSPCQACPKGKFRDQDGVDATCADCPSGKFNTREGLTKCEHHRVVSCPVGNFLTRGTAAQDGNCTECGVGQFQDVAASSAESCQPHRASCHKGTELTEGTTTRDRKCVECDPGRYNDDPASRVKCQSCGPGQYQDQIGQPGCKRCSPGTKQDESGATVCMSCTAGKFQDAQGQTQCKRCEDDTYAPPGADLCRYSYTKSGWGQCSKACNGYSWRTVACTGYDASSSAFERQLVSNTSKCGPPPDTRKACNVMATCPVIYYVEGPWSKCSKSCTTDGSAGVRVRSVTCMKDGQSTSKSECAAVGTAPISTQTCSPRACTIASWVVSEWGACQRDNVAVNCGGGKMKRTVLCQCRPADKSSAPQGCASDVQCGAMPSLAATCSTNACDNCQGCSGHGECVTGACACLDGYTGPRCGNTITCPVQNINGECCPSNAQLLDIRGNCCGGILAPDGTCCTKQINACGECGGSMDKVVDVVGECCAGSLDEEGRCCASGVFDACGVCDGDGASCDVELEITGVPLPPDTSVDALLSDQVELDKYKSALKTELVTVLEVAEASITVTISTTQPPVNAVRRLQSASPWRWEMCFAFLRGSSSEARRLRDGKQEKKLVATAKVAQLEVLTAQATQAAAVPLTAAAAQAKLTSTKHPLLSQVSDENVGVKSVAVCQNSVCEAGERCLDPACSGGCVQDCPTVMRKCPAPSSGPHAGKECGGHGRCVRAGTGANTVAYCECYAGQGYAGKQCDQCTDGYLLFNGNCVVDPVRLKQQAATVCAAGQYKATATDCKMCPSGRYQGQAGQTSCKRCSPGKAIAGAGNHKCEPCKAGTYQDTEAQLECKDCVAGQFAQDPGQAKCSLCETGRHQNGLAEVACEDCGAGKYQDQAGQATCKPCAVGRASSTTLLKFECERCPAGRHAGSAGKQECDPCGGGTRSSPNGSTCVPCAAGTYSLPPQVSDTCVQCEVNKYNDRPGQEHCDACPNGKAQNRTGATGCDSCPQGQFRGDQAAQCEACDAGKHQVVREKPCTDCPPGQYNAGTGWLSSSNSQGCKECPRGQYMPPERIPRTQCSMCAKGKSQSVSGQTRCDECASGQVQDTEGRETCKNCTAGHFSADQAGRSCTPCAPGQYMGGEGAHSCEPCAKNHATDQSGASKCQKCQDDESTQDQTGYTGCVKKKAGCKEGEFYDTQSNSCQACPVGKYLETGRQGASSCPDCPTGRFNSDGVRKTKCQVQSVNGCGKGLKLVPAEKAQDSQCSACESGRFQDKDVSNATSCTEWRKHCGAGEFFVQGDAERDTACLPCPAGSFNSDPETNATACTPCDAGTFQDTTGAVVGCKACLLGHYQGNTGEATCNGCASGTHADTRGLTACKQCAVGQYINTTNATACTPCSVGKFQDATGTTSCRYCEKGKKSHGGLRQCTVCSGGRYQDAVGQGTCKPCAASMCWRGADGIEVVPPKKLSQSDDSILLEWPLMQNFDATKYPTKKFDYEVRWCARTSSTGPCLVGTAGAKQWTTATNFIPAQQQLPLRILQDEDAPNVGAGGVDSEGRKYHYQVRAIYRGSASDVQSGWGPMSSEEIVANPITHTTPTVPI